MFKKKIQDVKTISALLEGAEQLAADGGLGKPGAEHLVLAAIQLPDGTASAAFTECGLDAAAFEGALGKVHADALSAIGIQPADYTDSEQTVPTVGVYDSDDSMQELFQAATKSARARKAPLVGADVIVAACALENGTVANALSELGANREALRAAAERGTDTRNS